MLKRNKTSNDKMKSVSWDDFQHGVICGANIRSIKDKLKDNSKLQGDFTGAILCTNTLIQKWAIILHVRMDNGDQIDLAFKLYKTKRYSPARNASILYTKREIIPMMQVLFSKLSITEWVQLLGMNVYISTKKDNKNDIRSVSMLRQIGDERKTLLRTHSVYPDYFEIHKDFFNK